MGPGEHFDGLCRIAEGNFSDEMRGSLRKALRDAALFVFPGKASDNITKEYTGDEIDWFSSNFYMPFPTVVIEDGVSVTLLTRDDSSIEARPMAGQLFRYVSWAPLSGSACREYGSNTEVLEATLHELGYESLEAFEDANREMMSKRGSGLFYAGVLELQGIEKVEHTKIGVLCSSPSVWLVDDWEVKGIPDQEVPDVQRQVLVGDVSVSVQELMTIISPQRFVMEETSVKPRRKHKGRHARRVTKSQERSVFRVLKPNEIRKIMQVGDPEPGGTGGRKGGGDVRSHPRTFRHARYTRMRGKTIIVPSHWRGPTEAVVGGRRYVVRLDL